MAPGGEFRAAFQEVTDAHAILLTCLSTPIYASLLFVGY